MSNRFFSILCALSASAIYPLAAQPAAEKPNLLILMGSVREQSTSGAIAHAINNLVDRSRFNAQIVDPAELNLPMVDLELPQQRNPAVQGWAEMVNKADAIIIITPNYNEGYSGVTKNIIDSLSTEWNNKVVGLVGYAGGPDAHDPITFLMPVTKRLGMKVVDDATVYISYADRSVNEQKQFKKSSTAEAVTQLLNKIAEVIS